MTTLTLKQFNKNERAFYLIAILGLLFTMGSYLSGVTFKNFILGAEQLKSLDRVGVISGPAERQREGEHEFKPLIEADTLFNHDTIVSPETKSVTIHLNDGSSIELAPKSMVKLSFEPAFSIGGLSRVTQVEVVSGTVKGESTTGELEFKNKKKTIKVKEAAKLEMTEAEVIPPIVVEKKAEKIEEVPVVEPSPEPSVSPIPEIKPSATIEIVEPSDGARLAVARGSKRAEFDIKLKWKLVSNYSPLLILTMQGPKNSDFTGRDTITPVQGENFVEKVIKQPGKYSWEISLSGDNKLEKPAKAEFTVERDFDGLKIKEPALTPGKTKQVELDLDWDSYPGAQLYVAQIGKRVFNTKKTELHLTKDMGIVGPFTYSVFAKLDSGFIVHSPKNTFSLDFKAPKLMSPLDGSQAKVDRDGVLLTWGRTPFTEKYVIDVARDEQFNNVVMTKETTDNFVVFGKKIDGKFYWRVRSIGSGYQSAFTPAQTFLVTQ